MGEAYIIFQACLKYFKLINFKIQDGPQAQ